MIHKDQFVKTLIARANMANPWSLEALEETALSLGLDKQHHKIFFPEGISEVYSYYENEIDQLMYDKLINSNAPQKIREKIIKALEIRIIDLGNNIQTPHNIFRTSWHTSDLIWRYAGDNSTDFNFYTKRMLLSSVYIRARKYYLSDYSLDHIDTKKYIQNAIEKVIKISSLKHKIPKIEDIPILRLFS